MQPLKLGAHPSWEYAERFDTTQETPDDLDQEDLANMFATMFDSLGTFPAMIRVLLRLGLLAYHQPDVK